MKRFTSDFETCVWLEDRTYVWAFATCEIGNEKNLVINNSIDKFFEYVKGQKNSVFLFHNLKFDGEFLLYWLLKNGFKQAKTKEEITDKTFTTIISDFGQFYKIEVYFKKNAKHTHKATFLDSLKLIPFSVEDTAKYFKLPISKLELDYVKPRRKNHKLTMEEENYIKNDVTIMAKALDTIYKEGLTKMTRASNALSDYKEIVGLNKFNHYFPKLDKKLDEELRKSYKGGFTYLSPEYTEKNVGKGTILDVNSLYPSVMYSKDLPFGEPLFFEGKYKADKIYPLYIQTICCCFKLKKGKIPTIQIKNNCNFVGNEYLESSNDELVTLTLTNVDLKLFLENYDIIGEENIEDIYIQGWKFKSVNGLFKKYIDKWIEIKIKATKEKNAGLRQLAKLMLNSLYGKFATALRQREKYCYLEEDIVKYKNSEEQEKEGIYLPVGSFITAYAREKTIRTAQKIKDYSLTKYGKNLFVYSDTDSLHCLLPVEELKKFCEIDDVKLRILGSRAENLIELDL